MNWNEYILAEFPQQAFSRISIFSDPESLVADENIFAELNRRGYQIHDFSGKLALRFFYEQKIRHTDTKLIIIVREEAYPIEEIPYDIYKQAKTFSISLSDLFPSLNFTVIRELDRKDIPALFQIRETIPCSPQGEDKTCEFLLENLFSISVETINTTKALLRVLFWIHYDHILSGKHLLSYLIKRLQQKQVFNEWDIGKLILNADNFWTFLQERWECFIKNTKILENAKIKGPVELPFDAPPIKTYMLFLFSAGKIRSNSVEEIQRIAEYLSGQKMTSDNAILPELHKELENQIPSQTAPYSRWLDFAKKWAELTAMYVSSGTGSKNFCEIQEKINVQFAAWLKEHYHSLMSLPPRTPVMVHQIIRAIGRKISNGLIKKVALIVIDGLSFNQWAVLRPELEKHFAVSSNGTFAWIPTLTSISRQAIFAGKIPALFASSINTTAKEENLWQQAWEEYGIRKFDILYHKNLGNDTPENILSMIGPKTKICGLVIDKIDKIMHGMQLGNEGMHNQIRQWSEHQYLQNLLQGLLDHGFSVFMTSDHGNIECSGSGRLQDGVLTELKGERVRIYPDKRLADDAVDKYPGSFSIPPAGLPADMFPITLPCRYAFVSKGTTMVAHGGCSIEEVIVPFIEFSKKDIVQ